MNSKPSIYLNLCVVPKGLKTRNYFTTAGDIMKLFGKKKEQALPQQKTPFLPTNPQLPPLPPGQPSQKGTLAQNLGLDRDLNKLPPLPEIAPREKLPREDMGSLLPLPEERPQPKQQSWEPLPTMDNAQPALPKVRDTPQEPKAPVFIRLDKYNEILSTVGQMESRINELQGAIKKIGDVKAKEQDMINNWTKLLDEAKRRVDNVNQKLPDTAR